jgi:hypothetical protein
VRRLARRGAVEERASREQRALLRAKMRSAPDPCCVLAAARTRISSSSADSSSSAAPQPSSDSPNASDCAADSTSESNQGCVRALRASAVRGAACGSHRDVEGVAADALSREEVREGHDGDTRRIAKVSWRGLGGRSGSGRGGRGSRALEHAAPKRCRRAGAARAARSAALLF